MPIKSKTPAQQGFRMPAEWEPQTAIWLSWPHNPDTWGDYISAVEDCYIQMIQALQCGQTVNILINDAKMENHIRNRCLNEKVEIPNVILHKIPTADTWIRDYGPTFLKNDNSHALALVHWKFNAWGWKYDDLLADAEIPIKMNQNLKLETFEPDIYLEGGSIDVNGCGTLLTSEQCLLNKNRNPNRSQNQIEQILKDYLNVSNILWLKEGIAGDDTDGHIDDIARFVSPSTILYAFEEDTSDENYQPLKENYNLLRTMKDTAGTPFKLIKLPMPGKIMTENRRLPASYTNFYIGNKTVVVPIFGQKNDAKALKILQKCFPSRNVVGINCVDMVYGYGTLHCSSQQQPAP